MCLHLSARVGAAGTEAINARREAIEFESLTVDEHIAKVAGWCGYAVVPQVSADFFQALAETGINVEMISTSEIRISVVTRVDDSTNAVQALHSAFGLDADGEAVVYAGSGR